MNPYRKINRIEKAPPPNATIRKGGIMVMHGKQGIGKSYSNAILAQTEGRHTRNGQPPKKVLIYDTKYNTFLP